MFSAVTPLSPDCRQVAAGSDAIDLTAPVAFAGDSGHQRASADDKAGGNGLAGELDGSRANEPRALHGACCGVPDAGREDHERHHRDGHADLAGGASAPATLRQDRDEHDLVLLHAAVFLEALLVGFDVCRTLSLLRHGPQVDRVVTDRERCPRLVNGHEERNAQPARVSLRDPVEPALAAGVGDARHHLFTGDVVKNDGRHPRRPPTAGVPMVAACAFHIVPWRRETRSARAASNAGIRMSIEPSEFCETSGCDGP